MAPNAFCLWDTVIYLRASHTLLPRAFLEVLQKQAEWDWPQKDLNKRMFCTKCMNHEFWFTAVDITSNMTIAPWGYVSEHSCVNFIKSPRVSGFDEWESVQNAELLANVGEEEQERYASIVQVVFLVEHEEKMAKGHGADVQQDGTAGSTVAGSSKKMAVSDATSHSRDTLCASCVGPGVAADRWSKVEDSLAPSRLMGKAAEVTWGDNTLTNSIWQPANCKNQSWTNEQRSSFLVASVGGQRAPAAMEVRDDKAAVNGDAEERGHIVNQKGRNQEVEPLVLANGPRATTTEVNVGDLR